MYKNFPSITKRLFVVFLITSTCAVDPIFNLPEVFSFYFNIFIKIPNMYCHASTAYELLIILL